MSYDSCESYDMKRKMIVKSDEARTRFRQLLNEVEGGGVVEVRRYDTPTAVMVPVDWYERACAALENAQK